MRKAAEPAIAVLCLCAATLSGTCAESDGKTLGDALGKTFTVSAEALEAAAVRGFRESPDRGLSSTPDPVETLAAPYRSIGALVGSSGGVGGAASPPASPRWLFFHADHLGSPRVVTDSLGNVVSTHHYMPFGDEKPLPVRVSSDNNKFTGHERDVESALTENPDGLDYMLARYYGSSLDRFMSPDPLPGHIELPQTLNRYVYAANNPILYVDPDGLDFHLKCSGENAGCHNGRVGSYKKKKDGTNGRFQKTRVREKGGKLVDKQGNVYSGSVDSTGVHFTTQQGGTTTTYTGVEIYGSAPVSFIQATGALQGFSFMFTGHPHYGQDARGEFHFNGSQQQAFGKLEEAGLVEQISGPSRFGADFRSPSDNQFNATHFNFDSQSSGVGGNFHTGETNMHAPGHFKAFVLDSLAFAGGDDE